MNSLAAQAAGLSPQTVTYSSRKTREMGAVSEVMTTGAAGGRGSRMRGGEVALEGGMSCGGELE